MRELTGLLLADGALDVAGEWLRTTWIIVKVLLGFTLIIFVHELGHFLAAKYVGVRVDRFAIGFGTRLFGWRKGEGFTVGPKPSYSSAQVAQRGWGETDYCLNLLPLGGYVKMLGQDDIIIDEKTDEVRMGDDPRAFNNRPVGARMLVASMGVIFNFVFAILLLMLVFLIGVEVVGPTIGRVEPNSPAALAGLQPGDRISSVNGRTVDSFNELQVQTAFAEDALRLGVQRDGGRIELQVRPERRNARSDMSIGVLPEMTSRVAEETSPVFGDVLQPGDVITHAAGEPVRSIDEAVRRIERAAGDWVAITVERASGPKPGAARETLQLRQRAIMLLAPRTLADDAIQAAESTSLLGFQPRAMVLRVLPNSPAAAAGMQAGDVIAEWGPRTHPRESEIRAAMRAQRGDTVRVVVERAGKPHELSVTPQSETNLLGNSRAQLGVEFAPELDRLVIADIAADMPAAALNAPRGSVLLAVGQQPVSTWPELYRALRAAAGKDVEVRYRSGANEVTGTMAVPPSIVTELDLPPGTNVLAVNGERTFKVDDKETRKLPQLVALSAALQANVGKSVEIEYSTNMLATEPRTVRAELTQENADAWPLFAIFASNISGEPRRVLVSAHGNPFDALAKGWRFTELVLGQIFGTMKRVSRAEESATKNLSGPIGIAQVAYEHGKMGVSQLLFFLAFLSANLAVLNFLPLPVLDGGLMTFLILEKIRGRPLSLKAQMISTMVGLAVIGLCFVFVMIQDISRLF